MIKTVSERRGWEDGTGPTGQVELGVIHVAVELYVMFTGKYWQGGRVNNEGAQDRAYRGQIRSE